MAKSSNSKRPGHLSRFSNEVKKEVVGGADFMSSIPETLLAPLKYILKHYGPDKVQQILKEMEKFEPSEGPLSNLARKTGFTKELPAAETYSEKVVENLGKGVGAIGLGGAPSGYKALRNLPGAISTLGGIGTQSLAAPKIEEALPNTQVGQFAGNILSGIGGSYLAGKGVKSLSGTKPPIIPEKTYAQTLEIGTPEWRKQAALEMDLAKRDPLSGNIRQNIQLNQQNKIFTDFPKTKLKASEVVKDIVSNMKKSRDKLRSEYNKGTHKVMDGMKNPKNMFDPVTGKPLPTYKTINNSKTLDYIDELISAEPKGKEGFKNYLIDLRKQIELQGGNPVSLNALKKRLAGKANYASHTHLYEGEPKNALTKGVVHHLTEDLKEQIPGYRELMDDVASKYEIADNLLKGPVKDYVKSSNKNPKEFINKIFENQNEEIIDQFRGIISPEVYEKAAESYVGQLAKESKGITIRGFENQDARTFDLRKKLENPALQYSLPDKWKEWANNKAKEIHISEMSSPRGDIAVNAGRGIEVGDEAKLFGKAKDILGKSVPTLIGGGIGFQIAGPGGAAIGAGAAQIGEKLYGKAKTALQRNQMLTGKSPSQQIGEGLIEGTNKVLPQTIMASKLSKDNSYDSEGEKKFSDIDSFLDNLGSQQKNTNPKQNDLSIDDFLNNLEKSSDKTKSYGTEKRKIPILNPRRGEPESIFVD